MVKMQIILDSKKVNDHHYDIEKVNDAITKVVNSKGLSQKDTDGCFVGNGDNKDFARFGMVIMDLSEREWFMSCVSKWTWDVDDEHDDILYTVNKRKRAV